MPTAECVLIYFSQLLIVFFFFFLEGTAAGPTERSGVSQGQLAAAFLAVRSDKVATHTDTR